MDFHLLQISISQPFFSVFTQKMKPKSDCLMILLQSTPFQILNNKKKEYTYIYARKFDVPSLCVIETQSLPQCHGIDNDPIMLKLSILIRSSYVYIFHPFFVPPSPHNKNNKINNNNKKIKESFTQFEYTKQNIYKWKFNRFGLK